MSTNPNPQLVQRPNPIQNFQLKEDDFKGNAGRLNTMLQSLITAVQALQGTGGKTVLPSGVDVQGATVSGLGKPAKETDAISAGHADGNYSAAVIGPKLDVGGSNALKGLTLLWSYINAGATGTVVLAKITGGGSNGSLTVKHGIITEIKNPT